MPIFYHVARAEIQGVDQFDLVDYSNETLPCTGAWTDSEFKQCNLDMFEGKLSLHGYRFFYNQYPFHTSGHSVEDSAVIEYTYELVRRLYFPNAPSRFQSFFGVETFDEAVIMNEKFKNSGTSGIIYKVECESFFRADMSLLFTGICFPGNQILAKKYWNGESSEKPLWEILMQGPVKILEKVQ